VPGPTFLLVPVVLAPFAVLLLGAMWLLASLGVFFRDVGHAVGVVITLAMFLTPLFYPLEAVPEDFRVFIYANPLTFIVEQMRALTIWGRPPDWAGLGLYALAGWAIAWAGYAWFVKTRRAFADVL
jgi:lipopolysaccharide transport system permease protein